MPCFLYSHSEWNIKVTGGSQFLPLSGPISESTAGCICHQTSCLCASTGRDRLGQPLGFHYQEKVNIFRVLWGVKFLGSRWEVQGQWGMEEFREQKPVHNPQAQSLSATFKCPLGDTTSFTGPIKGWKSWLTAAFGVSAAVPMGRAFQNSEESLLLIMRLRAGSLKVWGSIKDSPPTGFGPWGVTYDSMSCFYDQ